MRYEDWDIILFPRDCNTPLKEFNVSCHVVPDPEFSHTQGSFGLPTLCCFIPSLEFGAPFIISIHCWDQPSISQFTRSYSKYVDNVIFEARLFIDGRLVASTSFGRQDSRPHAISNIFNFSKNGDLEVLKFPKFHREFLQQNRWSPGDNIGRIKLVLSEGFPRDSPSMPIERVKNIIAFSFQHAPLDILENSGIAWPNPSMWRQSPLTPSMPVPTYTSENFDSHTHPPRHKPSSCSDQLTCNLPLIQGVMAEKCVPSFGSATDPNDPDQPSNLCRGARGYITNRYPFQWPNNGGSVMTELSLQSPDDHIVRALRKSNTDTSMTDYIPSTESGYEIPWKPDQNHHQLSNFQETGGIFIDHDKIATNIPVTRGILEYCTNDSMLPTTSRDPKIHPGLATSLTRCLLNQQVLSSQLQSKSDSVPVSSVKSRKETRLQKQDDPSPASSKSHHLNLRKVSQQIRISTGSSLPELTPTSKLDKEKRPPQSRKVSETDQRHDSGDEFRVHMANLEPTTLRDISGNSGKGAKPVRNYTPTSTKAIDEEEQPRRSSPHIKMTPFVEEEM